MLKVDIIEKLANFGGCSLRNKGEGGLWRIEKQTIYHGIRLFLQNYATILLPFIRYLSRERDIIYAEN